MAYLDEYSSKQGLGAIVNRRAAADVAPDPEVVPPQKSTEGVEKNNFQIAQKIKEEKTALIHALSQFPVTAFWLLDKYRPIRKTKQAEAADSPSELAPSLENLEQYFLSANSFFNSKIGESDSTDASRQQLTAELGKFPYSFEDLTELVDVIVFAFKYRGLCYQPLNGRGKNPADIIDKRLEGMGRRTQFTAADFSGLIKTATDYHYDEQFLFLTVNEMHGYFSNVIVSEQSWLNSRQRLMTANSRLVLFIANQYKGSFLSFNDLVQEGQIGLIKAVDRFDHRLGFQFSTYAGYWIRQAISRALSRTERVVRVPCGQIANINKVFRAKDELFSKIGAEASVKQLADYTNFTENEINAILAISQTTLSLENFDEDEEENTFAPIDFVEQQIYAQPFNKIAEEELDKLLAKALKILSSREAQIICYHFGIDSDKEMTLQDIGSELKLTRERVRQIQVKALNKLKLNFGQQLMSFL